MNYKKIAIFIVSSWILLAILFGIYDLEISKAVYNASSFWGNFGADYGEAPGWGLIFIAFSVLIGSFIKDFRKQKIGGLIMIIIGGLLLIYYLLDGDLNKISNSIGMIVGLIIFTGFTYNQDWKKYQIIALVIILLALINVLFFVQIVKIIWGRVRFRNLAPNYSDFTPWYLPQGPNGNKSFPSGHASMGAMFFPLLILLKDSKWKNPNKIIITFLVIGWALFVGISRIIVGAHYASDVLFPIEFAALLTIILDKKIYQKKSKI